LAIVRGRTLLRVNRLLVAAPYLCMLATETVVAVFLFSVIFPVFLQMVSGLGETLDLSLQIQVEVIGGSVALQYLYWLRFALVPVVAPFKSVVVGHLVGFGSRVSFFFGGALFSTIFFRHLPELSSYPAIGQLVVQGAIVLGALFALYCYSRDLESLGKAIEGEAVAQIRS
jgi:hypothetical protein